MEWRKEYEKWLSFDGETRSELEKITDEKELEDRFYKSLEFGTGGLRGIMGACRQAHCSKTFGAGRKEGNAQIPEAR